MRPSPSPTPCRARAPRASPAQSPPPDAGCRPSRRRRALSAVRSPRRHTQTRIRPQAAGEGEGVWACRLGPRRGRRGRRGRIAQDRASPMQSGYQIAQYYPDCPCTSGCNPRYPGLGGGGGGAPWRGRASCAKSLPRATSPPAREPATHATTPTVRAPAATSAPAGQAAAHCRRPEALEGQHARSGSSPLFVLYFIYLCSSAMQAVSTLFPLIRRAQTCQGPRASGAKRKW